MKQFVPVVLAGALATIAASTLAQTATKPPHKPATAAKPVAHGRQAGGAKSARRRHAGMPRGPSCRLPVRLVRHPVFVPPPPVIELDEIVASRPADGAEQRGARPLPPHLPGAGERPVGDGRRRDRQAQRQDPDGLCRRPAPAQPQLPGAVRAARGLAAGLQRPSRRAGDLQARAGPPAQGRGRPHAGELRRHRTAVAHLRRRPHRDRRRCRPRRRAARAPAADGRRWRLQRRLRAARPEVDGRAAGRAGSRAVARPHPHARARGRFAARRAGAGRCQRAARRQLGRGPLGLHQRQHARGRSPLRAGGRRAARPGVVLDAGRRRLLGGAHQPAGRQSAEVRALSQARGPAWPDLPRPGRAEDARHADRAQLERAADRSPARRHAAQRPRRPPRAGAVPARRLDRGGARAVRRLARRRSAVHRDDPGGGAEGGAARPVDPGRQRRLGPARQDRGL